MMMFKLITIVLSFACSATVLLANDQLNYRYISANNVTIEKFKTWTAQIDRHPTECWAVSKPRDSETGYRATLKSAHRTELFYSFGGGREPLGQMSFYLGNYTNNIKIYLLSSGETFELFEIGSWAFNHPHQDESLYESLISSRSVTIMLVNAKGPLTHLSLSLDGFRSAISTANWACSDTNVWTNLAQKD